MGNKRPRPSLNQLRGALARADNQQLREFWERTAAELRSILELQAAIGGELRRRLSKAA